MQVLHLMKKKGPRVARKRSAVPLFGHDPICRRLIRVVPNEVPLLGGLPGWCREAILCARASHTSPCDLRLSNPTPSPKRSDTMQGLHMLTMQYVPGPMCSCGSASWIALRLPMQCFEVWELGGGGGGQCLCF